MILRAGVHYDLSVFGSNPGPLNPVIRREFTFPVGAAAAFEVGGLVRVNYGGLLDGLDSLAFVVPSNTMPHMRIDVTPIGGPDIDMLSAQLQAGSTVQFTYQTTGNPGPFLAGLYRSADANFDQSDTLLTMQTVTPSPTNPQVPGTFNLPNPLPPDPTRPYLLVVADPANQIQETDEGNNVASIRPLTDLAVVQPQWSAGGGVDFGYTISGADLPQPTTVGLYWASGTGLDTAIGGPAYSATTQTAVGTYGPFHVGAAALGTPPLGTKYLLAVADPVNQIAESDKANNVAFVASPAAVVNVVTHGFNPDPRASSRASFRQPYSRLSTELESLPYPNSPIYGQVKSYTSRWDSSSGWDGAIASVVASLFLPFPLNGLALTSAKLYMNQAAANAEQAAQTIDAYITNPLNGYLLSPRYGQVIDLIGHSRGAAVNARVSQLLTNQGYTVDQYTSLDGYSTDWQFPSNILGDISITGTATALRKVNYEVQQGLGQVIAPWLALLGIVLPEADIVALGVDATNWRAPDRFGFDNILIPGPSPMGDRYSNHTNIVDIYSNPALPFIYDNYEGYYSANPNSPFGPAAPVDPPLSAPPSPVDYSNFTDGSFKTLGTFWDQLHAANISASGDPLLSYWLGLVNDPTHLLASTWTVTGDARLVETGGQAVAELDQTDTPTSIGQYLELDSQASSIGFDLSVLSANPGDQLQVLLNDNVLGSFDLSSPSASGDQTVSLTGYASQMGQVSFRLVGPAVGTARVQLDNLTVNEAGAPLTVEPIPAQSAVAGTTFVMPITANDSAPGGRVTYSLDPGAPAGAVIDPKSGVLTWSVPTSVTPGDYPMTVRVMDNGNSALSATTSFTVTVGFLQQPTNLSTVSVTGAYGGSATLTATLTAGLPLGGPPVAGKVVTYTLDNGGTVTAVGTATTDQNGVATLTGVSLTGFNVGTFSGAITASFGGDVSDLSSSARGDLTVNPDTTSTTVVASADPSYFAQGVTFTATVSNSSASITPTGSVQFRIDGSDFGPPVLLVNGSAVSALISSLTVGGHKITAVYSGDHNFLASTGQLSQSVHYKFSGFLPPLNRNGSYNLGRDLPIKFGLTDAYGHAAGSLCSVRSLQIQSINGQGNPIGQPFDPTGAGGTGLRYDSASGQFVFNWKTSGLKAGRYRILLTLDDDTVWTLDLWLK
jgi:hypothetical protein